MIIEYVVLSLALKIIPVKNTKSFMKVLTVSCGGSLNLEILRGGRAQAVLEIQVKVVGGGGGGGGQKTVPSVRGKVWIFSGRTNLYEMSTHK